MGTVVKFEAPRRRKPAGVTTNLSHGKPAVSGRLVSCTIRLAHYLVRVTGELLAGSLLAVLAMLARPVRWMAQIAIVAFLGTLAIEAMNDWQEARILLWLAVAAASLVVTHAAIRGLTGALTRVQSAGRAAP